MKEITFRIEHDIERDCEKVTILEDGVITSAAYYHKDTDDGKMITCSTVDWYGVDLDTLYE